MAATPKPHRKAVKEAALTRKSRMAEKGTHGKIEGKERHKIAKKLGL